MAALKFSILAVFFLCSSCAHSLPQKEVEIENKVEGCFVLNVLTFDATKEPLLLTASVNSKQANEICPCKSAVMKYTVFQKKNGNTINLLSGNFSVLGKEKIILPIAVQKQLIFLDTPIKISVSCSDN